VARVGLLLRALVARFVQSGGEGPRNADLASRIGTLAGVRRSGLVAIGLERVAKPVQFDDYLRQNYGEAAENRPSSTNVPRDGPVVELLPDRAANADT
jgi:hypothetical protein